jgi:Tol biopolymer transport system component
MKSPLVTWIALVTTLAAAAATAGELPTPVLVTPGGGSHPTLSRDGQWLAFENGGIWIQPTAGGAPERVVAGGSEPDWGRPGTLIAVRGGGGLHTVDAVTHEIQLLHTGGFDDDPAWSPLGDEIALQSSGTSIVFVSYPGGVLTALPCQDPDGSGCEGEGPTWSPDGSQLAFEDGLDLLTVPRSGGLATLVHHWSGDVTQPAWSPDGQWLAFVQGEVGTGYSHLWITDARGSDRFLAQATGGVAHDARPSWSADGGTIYFTSDRGGPTQIWKVEVTTIVAERRSNWGDVKSLFR